MGVSPAQDNHDAHTAGVHHSGLFQPGQQFRGVIQRNSGGGQGRLPVGQAIGGGHLFPGRFQGLGGAADDGQHCSFDRIAYGTIGGIAGGPQGGGQIRRRANFLIRQSLGQALEKLGKDDAAVAAGLPKGPVGQPGGHGRHAAALNLGYPVNPGFHRQQHISAGVAIRHRIHIQGVEGVPVAFQAAKAGSPSLGQVLPLQNFHYCPCLAG